MKKFLIPAALVAALAVPMAAQAVPTTIMANDTFSSSAVIFTGGTVTIEFLADGSLDIDELALSALGGDADVGNVTFNVTNAGGAVVTGGVFDTITPLTGSLSLGSTFLSSGLRLFNGDLLTIMFFDGITNPVSVSTSLVTSEVPLPAAGGMLLTGLIAAGLVARRKKKQAA